MQHSLASLALRSIAGGLAAALFSVAAGAGGAKSGKPDPVCIAVELKIWALIERHENKELYASAVLVDIATLLEDAKSMCARGDVQSAMTIYNSALQDLTNEIHERRQE